MQIKIVAIGDAEQKTSKPTEKNPKGMAYSTFELTFKNTDTNKTSSKKLMSFDKVLYNLFQEANVGDVFDVNTVKEGEFWNWKGATKGTEGAAKTTTEATNPKPSYKSYDDSARQLSIIRQSTLKAAVEFVGNNPNYDTSVKAVFDIAKLFQDYVMNPDFKLDTVDPEFPIDNEVE